MSKILETAIAKVRKLPKGLQAKAAKHLLEYINQNSSASECVSIDEAREAYANADFVTLAKWRHDLGLADN
jgi:gentisate 1,2-dioxygenase